MIKHLFRFLPLALLLMLAWLPPAPAFDVTQTDRILFGCPVPVTCTLSNIAQLQAFFQWTINATNYSNATAWNVLNQINSTILAREGRTLNSIFDGLPIRFWVVLPSGWIQFTGYMADFQATQSSSRLFADVIILPRLNDTIVSVPPHMNFTRVGTLVNWNFNFSRSIYVLSSLTDYLTGTRGGGGLWTYYAYANDFTQGVNWTRGECGSAQLQYDPYAYGCIVFLNSWQPPAEWQKVNQTFYQIYNASWINLNLTQWTLTTVTEYVPPPVNATVTTNALRYSVTYSYADPAIEFRFPYQAENITVSDDTLSFTTVLPEAPQPTPVFGILILAVGMLAATESRRRRRS